MRILQVSSATTMGGGEFHVEDLCRSLVELGHEVHLAARPETPLQQRVASLPVTLHHVPLRNSLDLLSSLRLRNIIQDRLIDIVHAHVARDYLVCALARLVATRGELVLTRHHYLPIRRNSMYRWVFRQVGKVIAVSESVCRDLVDSKLFPPDIVVTIPNWINPMEYRILPSQEQARHRFGIKSPVVIGMIGDITPAKGTEEFVRAAAVIASYRKDAAFLIAGDEKDPHIGFRRHLLSLAAQLGVRDRLMMVGRVERLQELFPALTILAVPSWQEAFSIVLIQAMAAGVPVIASQVGGPAEIVSNGKTGLLIPPRNDEALAEAIRWLLENPDHRRQLAEAAREEVTGRFDRKTVIRRIESVYETLVLDRHPRFV